MNERKISGHTDSHRLPVSARTYWFIQGIGTAVILTALTVIVISVSRLPIPLVYIIAAACIMLIAEIYLIILRHAWYRYTVDGDEFHISRGRFIRRSLTVAIPSILHAEISQGPLLRALGLAEVRIKMVVGDHELGPVSLDEAERIRTTILRAGSRAGA